MPMKLTHKTREIEMGYGDSKAHLLKVGNRSGF